MKLLVGLGNPGPEYADTRHNVGVRVLERFAADHHLPFDERRHASRFGRGRLDAALEVGLLAPLTFMNRSGEAVGEAVEALGLAPEALLVVFDDVDLPFGRLRLRPSGGAGGHRGLADVLARLGTHDVPRLRFGVGRPPDDGDTKDHVLAGFSADERERLPDLLGRASEAAAVALREGVLSAMNRFNRDPEAAAGSGTEPAEKG